VGEELKDIRGQVLIRKTSVKDKAGHQLFWILGVVSLSDAVDLEDENLYLVSGNVENGVKKIIFHSKSGKKLSDSGRFSDPTNVSIGDVADQNSWAIPEIKKNDVIDGEV